MSTPPKLGVVGLVQLKVICVHDGDVVTVLTFATGGGGVATRPKAKIDRPEAKMTEKSSRPFTGHEPNRHVVPFTQAVVSCWCTSKSAILAYQLLPSLRLAGMNAPMPLARANML